MSRRRTIAAALVAATVLLAACSSGRGGRSTVENLAIEDDTTQAQIACILERVEAEFGVELDDLDSELSPEQELTVAIARDVCLLDPDSEDDTPALGPDATLVPASLTDAAERFDPTDRAPGEDEALDELWDACGSGEGLACDELFLLAPPGSDYEAFAFSCGGRENLQCTVLLGEEPIPEALTPNTPPPGEDSVRDPLWTRCAEGSAQACDQLLLTSPGGSDYYAFGNTCGGRAVGYCTRLLGDDGLPRILEALSPSDPPPGEDDLLDQLWVACGQRNAGACADLYSIARAGSLYERFAISCGGRAVKPCEAVFLGEQADRIESDQDDIVRQ